MTQSVNQTTQMLRNHTNFSYGSLNKTKHSYIDEECKLLSQIHTFFKDWYDPLPSTNTGI